MYNGSPQSPTYGAGRQSSLEGFYSTYAKAMKGQPVSYDQVVARLTGKMAPKQFAHRLYAIFRQHDIAIRDVSIHGSVLTDKFRPGESDLDILVKKRGPSCRLSDMIQEVPKDINKLLADAGSVIGGGVHIIDYEMQERSFPKSVVEDNRRKARSLTEILSSTEAP